MADKFGAPKVGKDTDVAKLGKLAQRVEKTLREQTVFTEPKQLEPQSVLVAPLNRDGAPPNVPHIHRQILKGFFEKGFDSTRPQPGICVEFKSLESKKKLLEHNHRFTKATTLLPKIDDSKALYGSLAGSHLNLALRLIHQDAFSPAGSLSSLLEGNKTLSDTVHHGHKWWVLKEDTPEAAQVDISLWRNQDQNENHGIHEVEILQTIVATADEMRSSSRSSGTDSNVVMMADLVAKSARRNPAKISATVLTTLCKFFSQFLASGDQHLIQELVDFHSVKVNPVALVVSNSFFQTLVADECLQKAPCLRHYLLLSHYTEEKVRAQASGPSQAAFVDPPAIQALVKKPEAVSAVETLLREARDKYLPLLSALSSPSQARLDFFVFADFVVRCMLCKPWPSEHKALLAKTPVGKFSSEKFQHLAIQWASWIDTQYPSENFAKEVGLMKEETIETQESDDHVDLGSLTILKRNPSDPVSGEVLPKFLFKRGDEVTIVRRMTWTVPRPGDTDFRKDIPEGTEATVEGWADSENKKLLVRLVLNVAGGPREIVHEIRPRNVQLTSEYRKEALASSSSKKAERQAEEDGGLEEKGTKKGKKNKIPDWLRLESEPNEVLEEKNWAKHLADNDKLMKNFWMRSRLGVCLETLYDAMPVYTSQDLVVCHRQNAAGAWKCELWTKRDFGPQELVFGPFSSQLKETHLTSAAQSIVGLPQHGPGAHPDGGWLALDGRTRSSIASQDLVDGTEHTGSFFWLVRRSSDQALANMEFQDVSWEQKIVMNLPIKRQRKHTVEWAAQDLPKVELLINKKAIKAHQRLVVFAPPKPDPKKQE